MLLRGATPGCALSGEEARLGEAAPKANHSPKNAQRTRPLTPFCSASAWMFLAISCKPQTNKDGAWVRPWWQCKSPTAWQQ